MIDATPVIQATLKGCAANVGPQIGVELEVGEIDTETSSTLPNGVLAVLPLSVEIGKDVVGSITLSAPIEEIVVLARRMLGNDEPDKERVKEPLDETLPDRGHTLRKHGHETDRAVVELLLELRLLQIIAIRDVRQIVLTRR